MKSPICKNYLSIYLYTHNHYDCPRKCPLFCLIQHIYLTINVFSYVYNVFVFHYLLFHYYRINGESFFFVCQLSTWMARQKKVTATKWDSYHTAHPYKIDLYVTYKCSNWQRESTAEWSVLHRYLLSFSIGLCGLILFSDF